MEKYPELDEFQDQETGTAGSGDFLSREREVLGEGAAEFNAEAALVESDGEAAQFESSFPALDEQSANGAQSGNHFEAESSNGDYGADTDATTPEPNPAEESEFIKQWRVKHELEIERRDKASADKKAETLKKAEQAIDDLYENYNSKKDKSLQGVRAEAEEYLKARDSSLGGGSIWSQVSQLIDGAAKPADGVTPVDKSRFKELIDSLKSDPNAPGAAGY